ncbi:hypothetical protein U8335_03925 [Roseiconus lacunae]|uniref:hypothetical protein n=1 Tax=Roseiconus lacunae TaxID=2605694 RepID=UPI00308F0761|nr:hypothetical protein U8335_03925 [Stieleria sp. HD01]
MKLSEFKKLRARIERAHASVLEKANPGFARSQKAESGAGYDLEVVGVKSPEQLEDEILNLFIWVWSMKDYLKALCRVSGADPKRIERIVNAEPSLMIVADVANRAKHGNLTQSRTGDYAKLDSVRVSIPLEAIGSIAFQESEIRVDVAIPDDTELVAMITFDSQCTPQDAFAVVRHAISAWEKNAFPLVGV